MSSSGEGVHILVFPFPAQGHMLSLLDLIHQLALHGLTITIVVTPKNLTILNPLLSAHPSIETLAFPLPPHPSLPSGVENVKDLGNSGNIPIINALGKLHDPIIQWFRSHPKPPIAILSDFFLGWTQDLAAQIGVPRITFSGCGALLISVLDYLLSNIQSVRGLSEVTTQDLPGSPSFAEGHLPSIFRRYRESIPEFEFVKDGLIANRSSWGFVFNSFDALEGVYLEYWSKRMGHGHVFSVGPLSLLGVSDHMSRGGPVVNSDNGLFTWLDGCADGSVLYVCFGSQKLLTTDQINALASGLEMSGVHFVWVIKSLTAQQMADGFGSIPEGFEERLLGRGVVVKGWASQVSILSHRAVGGFLSHCGWNSVLEGIVGGAMILGWPMEADQFVNARVLVDFLGVAIRVCEGEHAVPDPTELARSISEVMNGDSAEKVRARDLRDKAIEAVKPGGSSASGLVRLVKELSKLQVNSVK